MIDENKLLKDFMNNDCIEFKMNFKTGSEEEVVKSLQEFADKLRAGLVELIKKQPKIGEWIPVEERLPRKGEQVMVCNRYGSVFVSAITYPNARVLSTGECHDFGKHYGVVAWMPLPEPYMRKKVTE